MPMAKRMWAVWAVMFGASACAAAGPPPEAAVAAAVAIPNVTVEVDFSAIYRGGSVGAWYQSELAGAETMARVRFEEEVFHLGSDEDASVESWQLRQLFGAMHKQGTTVMVAPSPIEEGFAAPDVLPLAPTASVDHLSMVSGVDRIEAVLRGSGTAWSVDFRQSPRETSHCPADWVVPVGYVRFEGVVRRADGALLGTVSASRVLGGPREKILPVEVPAGPAPCDAILHALENDPRLARTYDQYRQSTDEVLQVVLAPLYSSPRDPSSQ